jgi:hypothetical protein
MSKGDLKKTMTTQRIFGLLVTSQNIPLIEKSSAEDQCYICGFSFKDEDHLSIYSNKELSDRRKVHQKCIQNHLQLLPSKTKIALISVETNEIITYTSVSENV